MSSPDYSRRCATSATSKLKRDIESILVGTNQAKNAGSATTPRYTASILSWIVFPTRAAPGSVDPAILRQMAMVAMPIIAAGSLGSMAFLSRYGLTRADHERNAAILAERRVAEAASEPSIAAEGVGKALA